MGLMKRIVEASRHVMKRDMLSNEQRMLGDPSAWVTVRGDTGSLGVNADYVIGSIIDRIATDISICEVKYTIDSEPQATDRLTYLLNVKSNLLQTASDFHYSCISDLLYKNDVFIIYDNMRREFENLQLTRIQFVLGDDGEVALRGINVNGKEVIYPYSQVAHLRNRTRGVFFSAKNDNLNKLIDIVAYSNAKELKNIAENRDIKGLLKINANLSGTHSTKKVESFRETVSEGIGVLDNGNEFIELKNSYIGSFDSAEKALKQVYRYFGVNEKILDGAYSEAEYNAYIHNTLEPLTIKLSFVLHVSSLS